MIKQLRLCCLSCLVLQALPASGAAASPRCLPQLFAPPLLLLLLCPNSLPPCSACLLQSNQQVADGHHQHHVSELVCDELEAALSEAVGQHESLEHALVSACPACWRICCEQASRLGQDGAWVGSGVGCQSRHELIADCPACLCPRYCPLAPPACSTPPSASWTTACLRGTARGG